MDLTSASSTGAAVTVLDLRSSAAPPPSDAYGPATAVTPPDAGTRAQPHHGFRPGSDGRGASASDQFNPYREWDGNADGWIDDPRHFLDERRRHYEEVWRAHEEGVARAQAAARQAQLDAIATSRSDGTAVDRTVPATASGSGPSAAPFTPPKASTRELVTLVELPEPPPVDVQTATTAYVASGHPTAPPADGDVRYL